MQKFNNILVCLDLSEMDYFLINYSNFLISTFKPEKLTFIHVMDIYDIPDEIMDSFGGSDSNLEDVVIEELEERIGNGLSEKEGVKVSLVLEKGGTTEKILRYSRKNRIDLSILGKKVGYTGQGSVAKKVVGLLPSSVLVISETSQKSINKILVRMDFSTMAQYTLEVAQMIAKYTKATIECHHVYKLPLNYFPRQTPENIKRLKTQVGDVVNKEYSKFLKKFKIDNPLPITSSLEIQADEPQLLYNHAIINNFDLILTGTRIKSPLANLILDSTSEKLVGGEKGVPVMVVKDRKESSGLLKAIFD